MKVQTKITLLLVLVVAIFVAGLIAIRVYQGAKFQRIAEERFDETSGLFEEFLNYYGEPLKTLAEYYTGWDEMVQAIGAGNRDWAAANVSNSTLESYHANAVWICKPDGSVFYAINNLYIPELADLPLGREVLPQLFAQERYRHFFLQLPKGLMEIRAATINPSKDFHRQTAPAGYFFAGRLWSNEEIHNMGLFTSNKITLVPVGHRTRQIQNDEHSGLVAFSRTLTSWDGQPLAQLLVRNESSIVRELNRSWEWLFYSLIGFAFVLFLILSISLMRWVSQPLRAIMRSLDRDDERPIARLGRSGSEFGQLARTIQKFFEQRANLTREMEERRRTEESLRKREDELRHSQKMEAVGRLAGGVAHDFNNLLTAIIGYSDLLIKRATDDPMTRQSAELIRKAGQQAAGLTRQLLAFSRKQLLQPRVLDLNHHVVDMEKLLRRVIGEHIDLRTVAEAEDGRVKADPSQLEQVILNLGVNARDAMPKGGQLTIRTGNVHLDGVRAPQISTALVPGDYVTLAVTDTGYGMDEETKGRIFEPFFTTKGPGKGTGLGLATVYGIVRQSGGGISVESAPSQGSTFTIYLPKETAPLEPARPAPQPVEPSHDSETVLVVEDEEIVRELVCDVLTDQGYNVLCASRGSEAITIGENRAQKIDLLITDVIMPQMNGQELARRLTEMRPDLKVLYVSGYSDNDIGDHGVLDARIEFLEKPFTPESLARKVREVVGEQAFAAPAAT